MSCCRFFFDWVGVADSRSVRTDPRDFAAECVYEQAGLDTRIITDDWSGYAGLSKRGYGHVSIAERGDPQVAEEFMPIIHLVFSNLKTWLRGIHHGVSPQHLQAYLNEFTFRFNRRFYPFNAFRSLLGIAGDVRAPTYAELYAAKPWTTTSSGCL